MFGRATPSPIHDILRFSPQLLLFPRAVHREQLVSKIWVCRRCYHHSQPALTSERAVHTEDRHRHRRTRAPKVADFNSHSRALSTNSSNAADMPRGDLPSQEEGRRSHMAKKFSHVMDHLQSNIFIAGQRLNDLTGYSGIEALKKDIEQQGRSSTHTC